MTIRKLRRLCHDCGVVLSAKNQYPSCRKRSQWCCKKCWNQRFYIAVRKYKYGLSKRQFFALLESQNGRCAICQREIADSRVAVDHNHETGEVRGLLCPQCNSGIGLLQDSPAIIRAAAAYLETKDYMRAYRERSRK